MHLDLSADEMAALMRLLRDTIADDRYPLSARVRTLQGILDKLEPPPAGTRALAASEDVCAPESNDGTETAARVKSKPGPPMTLGNAAAARVRLIVWCKACQHQIEPDPAEMAERYGAETTVPDWRMRLVCSNCGGRNVDMVVTGTRR